MVIRLNRVDAVDSTPLHTMAHPLREAPEQIPIVRTQVTTVESVANSALFRLPRELRDQIYKIALELSQPLGYITVSSKAYPSLACSPPVGQFARRLLDCTTPPASLRWRFLVMIRRRWSYGIANG